MSELEKMQLEQDLDEAKKMAKTFKGVADAFGDVAKFYQDKLDGKPVNDDDEEKLLAIAIGKITLGQVYLSGFNK